MHILRVNYDIFKGLYPRACYTMSESERWPGGISRKDVYGTGGTLRAELSRFRYERAPRTPGVGSLYLRILYCTWPKYFRFWCEKNTIGRREAGAVYYLQYFALWLAVRETGLPPPPIPHQNPRLAPRTAYQHAQTDFSIFGPCWPRV